MSTDLVVDKFVDSETLWEQYCKTVFTPLQKAHYFLASCHPGKFLPKLKNASFSLMEY